MTIEIMRVSNSGINWIWTLEYRILSYDRIEILSYDRTHIDNWTREMADSTQWFDIEFIEDSMSKLRTPIIVKFRLPPIGKEMQATRYAHYLVSNPKPYSSLHKQH